jgi:hypothetical protein
MALTDSQLIEFYRGCDYWPAKSYPPRPRELHVPLLISSQGADLIKDSQVLGNNKGLKIALDADDCKTIAPVLLHESLFHFYKAFYNYLAARTLYFGGMPHWIKVTLYYARFYIARSITVLAGKQSYGVSQTTHLNLRNRFFCKDIAEALTSITGKTTDTYRIRLEIDVNKKQGRILLDRERVSSHRDVWEDYKALNLEFDYFFSGAYTPDYLMGERNEENYSFEGYWQLDFNLPPENFRSFFEGDWIKNSANTIYDSDSADVIIALSTQLRLFRNLQVERLPIEKEKFSYLIDYCLPNSEAKEHLLMLCEENFPTRDLNSEDGSTFYDEQGRSL